jgi:mannose-1-phosphate guanylyltransferase
MKKAILLAAGLGTRLRPLTDSLPKCLLPINGVPLLETWVRRLERLGFAEAVVNTHWLSPKVDEYLAARDSSRLKITAFAEPELLGSAGTLAALARDGWVRTGDQVLVVYVDNCTSMELEGLLDAHHASGPDIDATLGLFHAANPRACGIVSLDANGVIQDFVEKPEQPRSDLAFAGIAVLRARVFSALEGMRPPGPGPFDLGRHVLPELVGRMRGHVIEAPFLDIGTPEAYREAQEIFRGIHW